MRRHRRRQRYQRYTKRERRMQETLVAVDPTTIVRSYDDLVAVLIDRRHELGWTQAELDERAGFTASYTSKLEAWQGPQGRTASGVTLPLWLEALGMAFVPVEVIEVDRNREAAVLSSITRPALPNELAHRRRERA